MKKYKLTRVLSWLQESRSEKKDLIPVPSNLMIDVLKIVGDNVSFKEDLKKGLINRTFLYQRILINKEFAYALPEKYWWEQYQFVQDKIIYFNNISFHFLDGEVSQKEKKEVEYHLLQLSYLSEELKERLGKSKYWMNQLAHLLG